MDRFSFEKIPEKGFVMAYFSSRLVFEPYTVSNGSPVFKNCGLLESECPSEIHFFDAKTEYRFVSRPSRSDFVEIVLTEEQESKMEPDLLFSETVLLKKEYAEQEGFPDRIRVINRYRYTENDTLVLKNYRMALV